MVNNGDWTLVENKPNSKPIQACPERSRMEPTTGCRLEIRKNNWVAANQPLKETD